MSPNTVDPGRWKLTPLSRNRPRDRGASFHVLLPGRGWVSTILFSIHSKGLGLICKLVHVPAQVEGERKEFRIADSSQLTEAGVTHWVCSQMRIATLRQLGPAQPLAWPPWPPCPITPVLWTRGRIDSDGQEAVFDADK